MGLCFSRKESPSPPPDPVPKCITNEKNVEKEKEKQRVAAAQPVVEVATEKKQVFVITQTAKKTAAATATAEEKDKKKAETPTKKSYKKEESSGSGRDRSPLGPVRTSSCTKEEVDAILIQCGRLSRSSSGKASTENGGGHRKYSGSKRSYDFDNEKKGEEEDDEWEKPISRPSPRRRTPGPAGSGLGAGKGAMAGEEGRADHHGGDRKVQLRLSLPVINRSNPRRWCRFRRGRRVVGWSPRLEVWVQRGSPLLRLAREVVRPGD